MLNFWYIDKDPNSGHVRNNYFPRTELSKLYLNGITLESKRWHGHLIFEPGVLHKSTDRITFKQVWQQEPVVSDNNVFVLQIDNINDEIFHTDFLHPLNILPQEVVEWLRRYPFVNIVFFEAKEFNDAGSYRYITVPSIEVYKKKLDIINRVIYLNCGSNNEVFNDGGRPHPYWFTILGCPFYPQLAYSTHFKYRGRGRLEELGSVDFLNKVYPEEKFVDKFEPSHKFLMVSGRARHGRILLASDVLDNIPEKDILYRVNRPGHKPNEPFLTYDVIPGMTDQQTKRYNHICNTTPLGNIDLEYNNYEEENWFLHPDPQLYKKIFLEIVNETFSDGSLTKSELNHCYDGTKIFITEKVMKPIVTYRPFIVNANSGFLTHLQKLGFKTFGDFWDESYDSTYDFDMKSKKIVSILKELNKLSEQELKKMYSNMVPILKHNRQVAEKFLFSESVWVTKLIDFYNKHKKPNYSTFI